MAKKAGRNDSPDELRAEIAGSRERLARDLRGLRYELDFPRKIKKSFQQQTVAWITAAAVVGALLILLPVRKKKIYVDAKTGEEKKKKQMLEAGFLLGALKIAATLLRPTITNFLKSRIELYERKSRHAKA
jgi:Protein of unknown function (DUF3618)